MVSVRKKECPYSIKVIRSDENEYYDTGMVVLCMKDRGGDFMRKTVSEQVVELIPIIMVLLICINILSCCRSRPVYGKQNRSCGVSGVVETAAVQDIESITGIL